MARIEPGIRIDRVQSHGVTLGYGRGHGIMDEKEECFPYLTVNVSGEDREVRVSADRYRDSEGRMGAWRWYVSDITPSENIGEVTRAKVREAITPLVEGWLADTYGTADAGPLGTYSRSRQTAFRVAISGEIRNMRTTADYRAGEALRKFDGELSDADRDRMTRAYFAMAQALEFLDYRGA